MPTPNPRRKITLAAIQALPPQTSLWDTELRGFCARRQQSTTITYLVKLRVNGRIRWISIGRHGQPWTPETARKRALAILADPLGALPAPIQETISFAAVADQFFAVHGPKLKPRTLEEYQRLLRLQLLPAFGPLPLKSITRADVGNAHASWSDRPRAANHALAVLSKLMSWAEDQGYRPEGSNPCTRVQRYRENKRERFLTADELARLGYALREVDAAQAASPHAIAAIWLLLYTGARLNEILTLEWAHVDLARRLLFLPDSKTGRKPVTLSAQAIAILENTPRVADNPYVIVGHRYGSHLVNLHKVWELVRQLANLPGVRLHDLRHTFASVAVAQGGSLPILGRHLGHSQPQTTQRYAHLSDDPVRALAETTGAALAKALDSKS